MRLSEARHVWKYRKAYPAETVAHALRMLEMAGEHVAADFMRREMRKRKGNAMVRLEMTREEAALTVRALRELRENGKLSTHERDAVVNLTAYIESEAGDGPHYA